MSIYVAKVGCLWTWFLIGHNDNIFIVQKLHLVRASTRVDSLKKVTLASGELDSLPHIRGKFTFLKITRSFFSMIFLSINGLSDW